MPRSTAIGPRSAGALRIADLGTGSGALLLALLTELPNATGIGTDISREALEAARDNAVRLGFDRSRAAFHGLRFRRGARRRLRLVVSNPPYIASGDIATRCRPRCGTIRAARSTAAPTASPAIAPLRDRRCELLKPDGHLVVELGIGQEPAVAALFRAAGLAPSPARPDLAGIPRALHARVATMTP